MVAGRLVPLDRRGVPSSAMRWVLAGACVLLAIGCQSARDAASSAAYTLNPFASTTLSVQSASVQGPYLLVDFTGRHERFTLLAPATEECAAVLQPEAKVRYSRAGNFGRVDREEQSCMIAGTASLENWRDRQPRRRSRAIVPRETIRFSVMLQDEQWIFLRGRFSLASKIGIPAGFDLVAMLPNDEVCRAAVQSPQATMEFRPAGRDPYRILVGNRACVVAGFATPPPGR